MFEPFAEVPCYPLVFPVFWGAAVVLRPRDGPPPAGVRGGPRRGPDPFADVPRRARGLDPLRLRPDADVPRPAGRLIHFGIFWGFVLLTIGTANIVTGGLIQAVLSIPFDGALWAAVSGDAERRRGHRARVRSRGRSGGGSSRARRG